MGDDFLKQSLQLLCELVQRTEDEKVAEHAAAVIGAFLSKSGGALSNQIEDQVLSLPFVAKRKSFLGRLGVGLFGIERIKSSQKTKCRYFAAFHRRTISRRV